MQKTKPVYNVDSGMIEKLSFLRMEHIDTYNFTMGNVTEVVKGRPYPQKHTGFNQIVKLNQLYDFKMCDPIDKTQCFFQIFFEFHNL